MFIAHDVFVAEQILGQEDGGSDVAGACQPEESPAHRYPALGLPTLHGLMEFRNIAPPLDGPRTDIEKGGDLLNGALHSTELLKFCQVDFGFRPRHESVLLFEQPQFGVPVREREKQSLHVGVPGNNLRLDFRDLAAASLDSCGDSQPFGFDLLERPAISFEHRLLADERLPPKYCYVHVLCIKLDSAADPLC